jgi:signal transduction histidine kinase
MSDKLQENISRIIEANHVLQEDLKRQEETDKMRKQFIANVSHDFKTPLTLIVSYAEALRDLPETSESIKSEYCNIVIDEGNKMNELVQMLLKLSQLESGMLKIEKTNFSIDEIVSDIMKNHRLLMDKKQIKAEKYMDGDYIVNADYQKIELVITNLLENAIKYSKDTSGMVEVISYTKDGYYCLTVKDNGIGIPKEEIPRIFERFYRVDKSRKKGGTGLGLAITKSILEGHGCQYGAENTNNGVCFFFEVDRVDTTKACEN